MARRISHVWRCAAWGALIILAAGPGIVISLVRWITTSDAAHGIEAITIFTVAGLMGGGGGAVYALVRYSRRQTPWWHYVGFLAAMEAYLTIGSALILEWPFSHRNLSQAHLQRTQDFTYICIFTVFAWCHLPVRWTLRQNGLLQAGARQHDVDAQRSHRLRRNGLDAWELITP